MIADSIRIVFNVSICKHKLFVHIGKHCFIRQNVEKKASGTTKWFVISVKFFRKACLDARKQFFFAAGPSKKRIQGQTL
ncbi:hypothetical protein BK668_26860 [Pseudomonas fluorescens]|nr:hypothetical protein BK668_26860 [Pseudomonas fluorescens]